MSEGQRSLGFGLIVRDPGNRTKKYYSTTEGDTAEWTFTVTAGKTYQVLTTWPDDVQNAAPDAPYTLHDGSSCDEVLEVVEVNQLVCVEGHLVWGEIWEYLGEWTVSGSWLTVVLTGVGTVSVRQHARG